MAAWIEPIEAADVRDGDAYFLARRPATEHAPWYFLARDIKGKRCMSTKPGIALRLEGGDKLRATLLEHPDHVAVKVPADADTRWTRRKRRF